LTSITSAVAPEIGQLVRVRDRFWVIGDTSQSAQPTDAAGAGSQNLLTLVSVEDDGYGQELQVIWELEPGAHVFEQATLPVPDPDRFDDPGRLEAFLDAIRWGAITSADSRALQSPFRSGISIEDYQLDPVVRALRMPRVNLLVADDVGLGKTIEAGLVVQELLLRHRARTVLIVCPASLCVKWRDEMAEKFGLEFRIVDSNLLHDLRRSRGLYANPWTHFPRLITSIDWLKRERPMRLMRDVLPGSTTYPRQFDLLIVDEVHSAAPSGRGRYATDSLRTKALRTIGPHFEHRKFLSATPHNGYTESFTALLELLDNQRFARGVPPSSQQLHRVMVRRLKSELSNELPPKPDGSPYFPVRRLVPLVVDYTDEERQLHAALQTYSASRTKAAERAAGTVGRTAAQFVLTLLKKRLFSSPAAFLRTLAQHVETVTNPRRRGGPPPSVRVLAKAQDNVEQDFGDEDELEETWEDALATAGRVSAPLTAEERNMLDDMRAWAQRAVDRGDTKLDVLVEWLDGIVRPDGDWNDERVIIFTEYRDTQVWLQQHLAARGLGGDRLALLWRHGQRHAGAGQGRVPGGPVAVACADPAGDRCGQRGHRPAAPLPSAAARRDSVEPQSAGAAQRPCRPAWSAVVGGAYPPLRRRRLRTGRAGVAGSGSGVPGHRGGQGRGDPRRSWQRGSGHRRAGDRSHARHTANARHESRGSGAVDQTPLARRARPSRRDRPASRAAGPVDQGPADHTRHH
jgi:hypothetical protein